MPESSANWPLSWEDYEAGRSQRHGSDGSLGSHVQFDEAASNRHHIPHPDEHQGQSPRAGETLRHRRSSLSMRLSSVAQAGGPNSIENFARSWSRAAAFIEIPSTQPTFIVDEGDSDSTVGSKISGQPVSPQETRSLLRQQLERHGTESSAVIDDESATPDVESPEIREGQQHERTNLFDRAPYLNSPYGSTYGGVYGSISSRTNESPMRHANNLFREQQNAGAPDSDKAEQPLLIKVVEQEDGTKMQMVVGQSTLPQTVFNSINVLIGVGLLSLPLGLKQSGWIIGMLFLFFAAVVTRYTASVLARCLNLDPTLVTFSDLAWKAFGPRARLWTALLFTLELLAACVALVILFADSLDALIPGFSVIQWKVFCGILMIPLSFVPLRYLSFTSVLGIISCMGIVLLILISGALKPSPPGSLLTPIPTPPFPARWSDLPLSFGLLMSPWGGHSVFPNIYRDMRHPRKYARALNSTYIFTYSLDLTIAIAGYLMFGPAVRDEITANIFATPGYPAGISVAIVVFIAIIPLTKLPLNARPIFVITEDLAGLSPSHLPPSATLTGLPSYTRAALKSLIRLGTIILIVGLAIAVPGFDTVMALLGSAMAFSICIILPLGFNLKLFGGRLSARERWLDWGLIVGCSGMAVVGTVWVFLPREVRWRLDGF